MPELPEVQTIASELDTKISGKTIVDFWTDWSKSIKSHTPQAFKKNIVGSQVKSVERIGKNIIINLSKDRILLVHQKMTGHLMVGRWRVSKEDVIPVTKGPLQEKVNQYIHALWTFSDGTMMALSDMRKFGRIELGSREDVLDTPGIKNLGPDALSPNLTQKEFNERISSRSKSIKLTLMDPSVIAGIGNIYADDILWSAKVHPLKPANEVSTEKLKEVYRAMRKILKKAVELRGTSVGDYRDASGKEGSYARELLVYQRTGEPCKRCKTPIEKTKAGQRSAHFCPKCQAL